MNSSDRIVERPPIGSTPARWFFKTSEGLMGPFDSLGTAQEVLESFVARCQAGENIEWRESH